MTYRNKAASFYPRRLSQYVPAMTYHADIGMNGIYIANLGQPAVANTDGLLDGITATSAAPVVVNGLAAGAPISGGFVGIEGVTAAEEDGLGAQFGRNITLTGAPNPHSITVYGWDYLGQYMAETLAASATTNTGVKAFARVEKLVITTGSFSGADVGWGTKFGLPFATKGILAEYADEASQSLGTFVDVLRTDPQTLVTTDPRGTYIPGATPNGVLEILIIGVADQFVNSDGNGGLHGIPHAFA